MMTIDRDVVIILKLGGIALAWATAMIVAWWYLNRKKAQ